MLLVPGMSSDRAPESDPKSPKPARPPQAGQDGSPDPKGQSPEDPIEFDAETEVARGNEERANAEPEPQALHSAEVPGKPDLAQRRRDIENDE
jgi:hypothetical protein